MGRNPPWRFLVLGVGYANGQRATSLHSLNQLEDANDHESEERAESHVYHREGDGEREAEEHEHIFVVQNNSGAQRDPRPNV